MNIYKGETIMKLDFQKISDVATLLRAGMTVADIKAYAEVIETAPDLPKDATLEDVKAAAEIKAVDELPKADENKEEDSITKLRNLIKED